MIDQTQSVKPKARRAHGEGGVYQTADGRWRGVIEFPPKPDGTRDRRLVRGKTKTEVANKLKVLRDERDSGVVGGGRLLSVEVWSKRWLASCQHLKPRTLEGYQQYLANYIVPGLGAKQLSKLSRTDCEHFFTKLGQQQKQRGKPGETLSSGTVHTCRRILRACLGEAVRQGLIARNPAAESKIPRLQQHTERPYDLDEIAKIMATIADRRNGARWALALLGLRQGEALGLCWDRVDLDSGIITVERALYRAKWQHGCQFRMSKRTCGQEPKDCPHAKGGSLSLGSLKTTSSARTIALPAPMIDMLRAHQRCQHAERVAVGPDNWDRRAEEYGGFVFGNQSGGPLDPKSGDWREWRKIVEAAGVRTIRIHDLRHTSATQARDAGVAAGVIAQRHGWSTTRMLDRYGHATTPSDQAAADAMGAVMFGLTS